MEYSIGQFSEKTGLGIHTLRWYEKEGLLFDIARTKSGRRLYSDKDVEMVEVITCLKNTGMSIEDIKDYIDLFRHGSETYAARVDLFKMQRNSIKKQMVELSKQLAQTEYKIWYYQNLEELGDISDPKNCDNMKTLYQQIQSQ